MVCMVLDSCHFEIRNIWMLTQSIQIYLIIMSKELDMNTCFLHGLLFVLISKKGFFIRKRRQKTTTLGIQGIYKEQQTNTTKIEQSPNRKHPTAPINLFHSNPQNHRGRGTLRQENKGPSLNITEKVQLNPINRMFLVIESSSTLFPLQCPK